MFVFIYYLFFHYCIFLILVLHNTFNNLVLKPCVHGNSHSVSCLRWQLEFNIMFDSGFAHSM